MNRILTADVILTLTAEQARQLLLVVLYPGTAGVDSTFVDVLLQQCAKQGVHP